MANQPPLLTDRAALLRNRARAAKAPVAFLHEAVAAEVHERLQEVNRAFTDVAIVTGHPDIWAAAFDGASVVADDDVLSLPENSCDLVIHAMSLHWANDPVGQLVQCRRALRPDGLCIAALFGGRSLHELRAALAEAEAQVTGGLSPRVAPMGEVRDLGALLQRAGFALPVADVTPFDVAYRDAFHLMRDLRGMGETNALNARLRHPTKRAVLSAANSVYASAFGREEGGIPATFEVVTLTGWAPSDDQQKPLRPGSAKARLAEALNTKEHPLDPSDR